MNARFRTAATIAALAVATFAFGCVDQSASAKAGRCAEMKRELEACLGTAARALDCSVLSDIDVERGLSFTEVTSCRTLAEGVTIDGDSKSASCRLYGVGCVAARTEAPSRNPTRYPVLLVNGIDTSPLFRYSDRIVRTMTERGGHSVHLATLSPYETRERRAPELWKRIEEVRRQTGAAKVNLVCHSMGGLDCRYVASPAGLRIDLGLDADDTASAIASITTIATAHRGTRVADVLLDLVPDGERGRVLESFASLAGDVFSGRDLDTNLRLRASLMALTTSDTLRFNDAIEDAPGVYYQSWAGYSAPFGGRDAEHDAQVLASCVDDDGLAPERVDHDYMALPLVPFDDVVEKAASGARLPHDGFVTVTSAKWGHFRGCFPADHMEQLGQRNLPDANVRTGFDVARFYANVAGDLAERGF